jgi:hypothetical protein
VVDLVSARESVTGSATARAVLLPASSLRGIPSRDGDDEAEQIWNPATGRFHGPCLRLALVMRAWNVEEFAEAAGISRACAYGALAGKRTRLTTAAKVMRTLARRPQLAVAHPEP